MKIGAGIEFKAGMPISVPGFAKMIGDMARAWNGLTVHNGHIVWSSDGRPKIVVDAASTGASLAIYEAVTDEASYEITAKRINQDGTFAQDDDGVDIPAVTFDTLTDYTAP